MYICACGDGGGAGKTQWLCALLFHYMYNRVLMQDVQKGRFRIKTVKGDLGGIVEMTC